MNEPDWAEFIFTAGGSKYYGGVCGYLRVSLRSGAVLQDWTSETYRHWKEDAHSVEIVRQLEND